LVTDCRVVSAERRPPASQQDAESEGSALLEAISDSQGSPDTCAASCQPSTPAARQLAAVRLRLARLELRLANEAAAHAGADRAARRPPLPPVPPGAGPPPAALLAYLDAGAGADSASGCGDAAARLGGGAGGMAWEDLALLHATSASAAAGAGPSGTRVRAGALLAAGQALGIKATAGAGGGAAASAWRAQSLASLRAAAAAALEAGDMGVARAAALALARWQRGLGDDAEAAEWLAVAQSAAAACAMRAAFLAAAACGEGAAQGPRASHEVLAWRRRDAAASGGGCGTGAEALAQQVRGGQAGAVASMLLAALAARADSYFKLSPYLAPFPICPPGCRRSQRRRCDRRASAAGAAAAAGAHAGGAAPGHRRAAAPPR
jgi:hypothetical protein